MKEKQPNGPLENILKETQTVITILYIFAVGVGMLFNYQKYSEFGINIFDYAGVFEFLVAPFADYRILLFTFISVILSYLVYRIDKFWSTRSPGSYSKLSFGWHKIWRGRLRYISFWGLMILYLYISADVYGGLIRKDILDQPVVQLKYIDNQVVEGKVIGIASKILFLYTEGKVSAVPVAGLVKEFEIK